jgi:hypothetical protein
MRVPEGGQKGGLSKEHDLRSVSRAQQPDGSDPFRPPDFQRHTRTFWDMLKTYLDSVDDVLAELKVIVDNIKLRKILHGTLSVIVWRAYCYSHSRNIHFLVQGNTVIIMTCNHGQSELLLNFACSAKTKGLDVSNVLVFATDKETKELAEAVGLSAYYDKRVSGVP